MNKIMSWLAPVGAGCLLMLGTVGSHAQAPQPGQGPGNRGNFDPAEFQKRQMERYRERLEVKSDDEWKLISERIEKVSAARREIGGGGMFGRGRGPGGGGGGAAAGAGGGGGGDAQAQGQGGRRGGRGGGFGADSSPEGEALQNALESKASAEEIKTKLAKLRDARKAKEAKLEKAQDDLRQVLTVRQEAEAVLLGLLK